MKIDGDVPNIPTVSTERLDRTADRVTSERSQPKAAGTDGFQLSPEAQLVQSAVQTAAGLPDIRQDVVDRMRALLDRGEVGNDPHKLADALIDRWLTTP